MAKDFSHRTKATQRYSGTTAGFMNDPIHVSGVQNKYPITPTAGYVLVTMIVNTAPASGIITLQIGNDMIAQISSGAAASFEHKYNCYLYDQLFYSTDATADVTFIVSKGTVAPNA